MPRRQNQIVFLLSLCAIPSCFNYFSARYVCTDAHRKIGANITSLGHSAVTTAPLQVVLRRGTPMSSSDEKFSRRDEEHEHKRYAPRWVREQRPTAQQQAPFVDSASMVPTPSRPHQDWPPISDFNSGPQSVPEPPVQLEEGSSGLVRRIALFVTFAATVALLIISAKPLSQLATGLFETYSGSPHASKTNRIAASNTVVPEQSSPSADRAPAPVNTMAVAAAGGVPLAQPQQDAPPQQRVQPVLPQQPNLQMQQAALPAPVAAESGAPKNSFRGVTENEIRFGISAPFSGAAKELGQNMRLGIEAAFSAANAAGGVF